RADGAAELLDQGRSVALGVDRVDERPEATTAFGTGDTLLLYTDGLVEDRATDIDERIAQLVKAVESAPARIDPESLCDLVLQALYLEVLTDDIALLAITMDDEARACEGVGVDL